jgi:hypothetical protein
MKLPMTGGCQCGAVRYEVTAPPLTVYACHCGECQRLSASAFGMSMPVPLDAVRITAGAVAEWQRTAASGATITAQFCPDCGTRLLHLTSASLKTIVVKPGTLDDTSWLEPVGHVWAERAQPWMRVAMQGVIHERQPTDLSSLIAAWRARG